MTIRELIDSLERQAAESPLGDNTVVHVSMPEIEYIPVTDAVLEADSDGAVSLVKIGEDT